MEAFIVSLTSIAVAEMGDRTQLLALVLVARFRKPWPIVAGVLCATLANHGVAGLLGAWFGKLLTPAMLDAAVGVSMLAMALWSLKPDTLEQQASANSGAGAFVATLIAFFLAEIGDKTQIATVALAAAYPNLVAVIGGTTCGMLIANVPGIFLRNAFAQRLPLRAIHYMASALFAVLGVIFIVRAARQWS